MSKKQRLIDLVNQALVPLGFRLDLSKRFRSSKTVPLDGEADLSVLVDALADRLELAVLGSLDDEFEVPPNLAGHVRIFSLDGVAPAGAGSSSQSIVPLRDVIAGQPGPVVFHERVLTGVSSTLRPKQELVAAYGLEWMYRLKKEHHVEAVTMAEIAREHGVRRWDYIRTDLEGADFSVVSSLGEAIANVSVVEMELRVEPFYDGEPPMHEVLAYMHAKGFEVLDLKPERWRASTEHRDLETRGRVTFCNTVFVNAAKARGEPVELLRHALLVGLVGYANFAERLVLPLASTHPRQVKALQRLLFGRGGPTYMPMEDMRHVTHGTSY